MICEDCEEKIAPKRVEAFTKDGQTITTCVQCQEDREKNGLATKRMMLIKTNIHCGVVESVEQVII